MAKPRYSVLHAFHHPTGEKDGDGNDVKKFYTRDNQHELGELPQSVLKEKAERGVIAIEDGPEPAEAEPSDRVGSAVAPAVDEPEPKRRKSR